MTKILVTAEVIDEVLRSHFGLDPKEMVINFELIERHTDPDRFEAARKEYEANLADHPNRAAISQRLYVGKDFIIYLQSYYLRSEVRGISQESHFYYPICTIKEIKRIEQPRSCADLLLKLRADAIADEPRMVRIFLSRRMKNPQMWSLSSYFDDSAFEKYLGHVPLQQRALCKEAVAGFAFLREPNGLCMRSRYGNIIVLSEALKYFLYYMNLFVLGEQFGIDINDRFAALLIGLRTMLLTESLDFDLDGRGELPPDVHQTIREMVDHQVQFAVGHEYAHVLLGHLNKVIIKRITSERVARGVQMHYYSPSQLQEFAADVGAIAQANFSLVESAEILNGAFLLFTHLYLFRTVTEYVSPSVVRGLQTHPDPLDRLWNLHNKFSSVKALISEEALRQHVEVTEKWRQHLIKKVLPFHVEDLERYGSLYLPSFRTQTLSDRFDF